MREPLLLPLVAVCVGIVLGQEFGFALREAVLPTIFFAGCSLLPISSWLRRLTIGLSLIFAGAFLVAWHRPSTIPSIDSEPREVVTLEGCVVEPTIFSDDRAQFTMELAPGARARVSAPSRATTDESASAEGEPLRLLYGQRVEIEARVRPPHNFNNPGAFDYTAYLAHQNIFWTALVPSHGEVRVVLGQCGSRFMDAIFAMRTAALQRIDAIYADDDYASAMLEAVLIGESRHLERLWTEDFRRSGTYHALVISGLHITVLASVLLFLLRFAPISKGKALILTALAAWLYAAVSGFSAPVLRAAAGFTLFVVAQALFRRTRPLNLLAAIALGFLAWDPTQLFDASFQLSFLAVAAISALASPLMEISLAPLVSGLRSITNVEVDPHLPPKIAQFRVELRLVAETIFVWTRIPIAWASRGLALILRGLFLFIETGIISAAIQIGLALPMAVYFHRLSFTGITANLLVVPLMNAVVPAGFLALFTQWHWAASLTATLLRWSARIAAWHANLEPAWRVPDPPMWLGIGFVAALILFAILLRNPTQPLTAKSKRKDPVNPEPARFDSTEPSAAQLPLDLKDSPRPSYGEKLRSWLRWPTLAAVFAFLALLIWSPWQAHLDAGRLELTAIDVGQGDSLLVVFPQGLTMVIDGGGRLDYGRQAKSRLRSNLDIGEDVVSSYLWSRGIRHIDILAATHAHQDHIGGLSSIMSNFHPREFWTGANPPQALIAQAKRQGVRVDEKHSGTPFDLSGATVEILAPTPEYAAIADGIDSGGPPKAGQNNDSLVLRLTLGSRSFLLTGDLERAIEYNLLASGAHLQADVLKVGHHGSKTSTSQAFLDAVGPSVAVISAGYDNSFGHPHPDVMARLEARGTAILRTDQDGLATVSTDGHRLFFALNIWQQHPQLLALPAHLTD